MHLITLIYYRGIFGPWVAVTGFGDELTPWHVTSGGSGWFGSGFPFAEAGECMETLLGFNQLLGDTSLPKAPRGSIRDIIERDTLGLFEIEKRNISSDG